MPQILLDNIKVNCDDKPCSNKTAQLHQDFEHFLKQFVSHPWLQVKKLKMPIDQVILNIVS